MYIQGMNNQYTILDQLGEGVFGYVWKAIHHPTSEVVAIKQLKDKSIKSGMELVEFEALSSLKGHPNIVELKDIIKQDNTFSYVFEYMAENLLQSIKKQIQPLSEGKIKYWMYQILKATKFMHDKGYIHRDMKPENILITENTLKLADFGMAKKVCSHCDLTQTWTHLQYKKENCWCGHFTDYVCTRWYRAPELLVHSQTYTSAIDMWSVGVIMAELFRSLPLFPGTSEHDQLYRICEVFGAPDHDTWPEGLKLATNSSLQFPRFPPLTTLAICIPNASPEALHLIQALCTWDPKKRLTASQAMQHPFFSNHHIKQILQYPQFLEELSYPCCMQEAKSKMLETKTTFSESAKESICKHTSVLILQNENILVNFQHSQQNIINTTYNKIKNKQSHTYTFYPNYISSYRQACNSIKIASTVA